MERQKSFPGKKGKSRAKPYSTAPPHGELIALGSKNTTQDKADLKGSGITQPAGRKMVVTGAKREASSVSGTTLLAKKAKIGSQTLMALGRTGMEGRGSPVPSFSHAQPQLMAFEEAAIDVEPSELMSKVLAASREGDEEKIEGLLCGAVRHLRNNRSKPDTIVYLSLIYLGKTQPSLFVSQLPTEAFCSVLKRDLAHSFKSKGNALVSVLACNVMMAAFANEEHWPDNFVKVFVDDMLGERVWVEREDCRAFVDNILTAFPTKQPPKNLLISSEGSMPSLTFQTGGASPMRLGMEEDDSLKSSDGWDSEKGSSVTTVYGNELPVFDRYPYQVTNIQGYVLPVVREHFTKCQPNDPMCRGLIRLMAYTAGYADVRTMAAQKLDMWLGNPKTQKPAQDLLLAVCCNCKRESPSDEDVILQLLKIRGKTKPNNLMYPMCIREMLKQHPDNVVLVVRTTLNNELAYQRNSASTTRNSNNMVLLSTCFTYSSEASSKVLAEVCQDQLANRDDCLRALRGVLRDTVRIARHDVNFIIFCKTLTERPEPKFIDLEQAHKERYLMNVADLISLSMLLTITPVVRDHVTRTEFKDQELIHRFRHQLADIQQVAIIWVQTVVPQTIDIPNTEFIRCFRKVLFMETQDQYCMDSWPPENDRNFMMRLMIEAPVLEDTLKRVIMIGLRLAREAPMKTNDCMDVIDQLVRRAAILHFDNMKVLQMSNLDMFSLLMNLSTYYRPENRHLPRGYTPPALAISSLYWKSWTVLLILAAFNPKTYGKEAWEKYPTLRCLMEMVITNTYNFPPSTTITDENMAEEMRSADSQARDKEVELILEFEGHMAEKTITKQNSLLQPQLTSLDPHGIARCPSNPQLGELKNLDFMHKIGQMLCRSRDPDFLLDIIEKQGTSKSMSWLAELVESSDGSLEVLPVQCLCEFLLHDPREMADGGDEGYHPTAERIQKHQQLLTQLQVLVNSRPDDRTTSMFDILNYFLQRLDSSQVAVRQQAIKGLSMVIVAPDGGDPMEVEGESSQAGKKSHDWLLKHMPSLPMFPHVKDKVCQEVRKAIQVETDPHLISSYIIFLSEYGMDQVLINLDSLALDVSQLIVERNAVMSHILPDVPNENCTDYDNNLEAFLRIFYNYVSEARCQEKGEYSWLNTQNQVILQWTSGDSATMHILVVHAMVIILSRGLPKDPTAQGMYRDLLEIWFPSNGTIPKAFLLDTSEEALLLPDWLKLRMIRSSEQRLVEAALSELEPNQMLLFVQSFGIPVSSMSRLLTYLDEASESDPETRMQILQVMTDPAYISRLIHIQRMRGAKGGDKFYALVTDGGSMPETAAEDRAMEVSRLSPPSSLFKPAKVKSPLPEANLATEYFKILKPEGQLMNSVIQLQPLLQALQKESNKAAEFLQDIAQKLESSEGTELARQLMTQPTKSCPVFKIFLTKYPSLHGALAPVLQSIGYKAGYDENSSLTGLIQQFQTSQAQHKNLSRMQQASIDLNSLKTQGRVSPSTFMECVEGMSDSSRLEPLVKRFMQESLQKHTTAEGTSTACNMLKQSAEQGNASFAHESLFTDWVELLDPEIVNSIPDLQEQLVFGCKSAISASGNGNMKKRRTPYLLGLLTHQSQWSTICNCLARILKSEKVPQLDPTSVLDFVWACRRCPKIWQGREVKTNQDDFSEDIFKFTIEQILAVVDYIVLEAAQSQEDSGPQDSVPGTSSQTTAATTVAESEQKGVSSRLDLLLACICDRDDRLHAIVSHIMQRAPLVTRDEEDCYLELLQELYLHFPYILNRLPDSLCNEWMASNQVHSKLDTVTHRLISVLGRAGVGKSADRMKDANMACRKLATGHPMLILRQLPLLAAVVGGRTQLTIGEMRHRNLLLVFVYVMGLLELLQPHIFHRQHTSLVSILHAFFTLFRAHGKEIQLLGSLVQKMAVFLQNFVTYDPQRAGSMLQPYIQLLSDLTVIYPDMAELKSLLTGLTLPRQNQSDTAEDVGLGEETEPRAVLLGLSQSGNVSYNQLLPSIRQMQPDTPVEDLLAVLTEVDKTSKRRVNILEHFEVELKGLMTHQNENCRTIVFTLIMRYIHHCPGKAKDFLPAFLSCLQHDDPEVVDSALKNLVGFTVLCQDEAPVLLQTAFNVGMTGNINSAPYISDTLQVLNMESVLFNKQGDLLY